MFRKIKNAIIVFQSILNYNVIYFCYWNGDRYRRTRVQCIHYLLFKVQTFMKKPCDDRIAFIDNTLLIPDCQFLKDYIQKIIMKLLLLYYLLCTVFAENCTSTFYANTSSLACKFNFIPYSSSCAQSKFNYCKITYCLQSTQSPNSTCSTYNSFTEFSYTNCMNYCCGNNLNGNGEYINVAKCADISKNKKSNTNNNSLENIGKILMVFMIIIGSVGILFVLACCVYRKSFSSRVSAIDQLDNPQAPKSINTKNVNLDQVSLHNLISNRDWKNAHINLDELPNCSICLSERPNLKSHCGHFFHPACLRHWLKKKFECGVCRGNNLSNFHLACNRCFQKETQLPIGDLIKLKRSYDKLSCPECL